MVARYVEGEIARIEGIPSHADYDRSTDLLYVADTDNGRIAVLDTTTGSRGSAITPNYDGSEQYEMTGATLQTLVDGEAPTVLPDDNGDPTVLPRVLDLPAGLELHEGTLYVTDHGTSTILAFDLQGRLIDWVPLDRPADSLGGIDVLPDGSLVVTDLAAEELLHIRPLPLPE